MISGRRWYVAQTRANGESVARENLERQGFGVYLPRFRKARRHARRTEVMLRPLFPQYLFVALDLTVDRWRAVMSTNGVRSLVSVGGSPAPLPDHVMDAIRDREDDDGLVVLPPTTIKAGTSVSVLDGLFSGCVGTLGEVTDQRRVAVLVSMLGRDVKTVVPGEFISAA